MIELADVLLQYSEWLDADTKVMKSEKESGDNRTHNELVSAFLAEKPYDPEFEIATEE